MSRDPVPSLRAMGPVGALFLALRVLLLLPVAIPIWFFYLLPFWSVGLLHLVRVESGAVVFQINSGVRWWRNAWRGWGGHAMPFAIVTTLADRAYVVRHELRHCRQWLALGSIFPVVYAALWFAFGYQDNPLEVDARAHEYAARQG